MKGIELDLAAAAELLGYSEECVSDLIERRLLAVAGEGTQRRIPLQSLARFVGISAERVAVGALRRVVEDPAAWSRVFASHPLAQSPEGAVGTSLRRAIAIAEIRGA